MSPRNYGIRPQPYHGLSARSITDDKMLRFQRQSAAPGRFSRPDDLAWLDDPSLFVRNPWRPRLLGPKARAFLFLCVLALIIGALAATYYR